MRPWLRGAGWLVLLALLLALGAFVRSPFLVRLRPWHGVFVLLCAPLITGRMLRARPALPALLRLLCIGLAWTSVALLLLGLGGQQRAMQRVAQARTADRQRLGRHLIAGFRSWPEIRALVTLGALGGVFVTQRNVEGRSAAALAAEIKALQDVQAAQGLPPLVVTTDQEGGGVSRLSPPLTALPPLATLATADREQVRRYAAVHGAELAALGVTVNLTPVVDLRFERERSIWDPYSRIPQRAIAADPSVVAEVARIYSTTLQAHGVLATAKHFPGLGRIREDTHFFAARLLTPLAELRAQDWAPFREVAAHSDALIMLGHVRVPAVDGEHLASSSRALVQGILRDEWHHEGVLITDDLCMAPVYHGRGGIAGQAVDALNAGVDLLLISYDGSNVYPVLDALLRAEREGRLAAAPLARSAARLTRMLGFAHAPGPHRPEPQR